jgi:hypothetical protein
VTNTGGNVPTGSVEFFDGATDLGAGTILKGTGSTATATFTISSLAPGSHSIQAVYTPTGAFLGSSGSTTQTVNAVTSTAVMANSNPSAAKSAVTFTATVTNTSGSGGVPAGSVEFFNGSSLLGIGTALSGNGNTATSTFTISTLAVGNHSIRAVFIPAGAFLGSTGTTTQTVSAVTSTAVSANTSSPTAGKSLTLTATVTNTTGGGVPTGSIEFYDGSTLLGPGHKVGASGNLVKYSFTISALSAGSHSFRAIFTSTGNFLGSTGTLMI